MKLSVLMMTYNHGKFIAQALESVLMQEVDFDYEIVIGEDFSQDNTREIILKYQSRYPGKFKLLLHDKNIGAVGNQIACMKACTGQYIAILEGDDYWTDPHKLQKQVYFLENNVGFTLCFHRVSILDSGEKLRDPLDDNYLNKHIYSFEDYLNGFYSHTSTILMVNDQIAFNPIYKGILPARDNTIQILLAEKGNSYYIFEIMSCYRVHVNGYWTSLSEEERLKESINFKVKLLRYYSTTNHKKVLINTFLDTTIYGLKRFINNKRYDLFLTYLFIAIFNAVKYGSFSLLLKKIVTRAGCHFKLISKT